jgi:GTP-binding protein LepA
MHDTKIRNFCIIAHIDHGKSTLADRLIEFTNTVSKRGMKAQLLDTMDIERERGITIKLQPVRMEHDGYQLNLIDTPGHVDFTYEVSRSLAAVEGALLLVDATQGVQAQTLANLYLAIEQNLEIIPVVNKIDLPNANVEKVTHELVKLLGCKESEVLPVSAKTGEGLPAIIEAIKKLPAPKGDPDKPLRALVFDSAFDEYRGVIAHVRVVDGQLKKGNHISMAATKGMAQAEDVGVFRPRYEARSVLETGEIGYIATGLKDVRQCRVGDTVIEPKSTATPLPGYREVKPVVFVGIFGNEGNDYERLRDALDRLQLNDSSLQFEPEHSPALGFGFRAGFLGLLHMEIIRERLKREYDLEPEITTPSVAYKIELSNGEIQIIKNPWALPDASHIKTIYEPWVTLDIITPKNTLGGILELVTNRRGIYVNTEYLEDRAILHFKLPLSSMLTDFYDKLKSITAGYASMNYDILGYELGDVVRLDIHVAEEPVESLSIMVHRSEATIKGRQVVKDLKESLPKQQFVLKIQAVVGAKVLASERLSALRKDVTAKLYGGDVTRKRKLLEKQKKGKKRMMAQGRGKVEIPADTILKILRG